MKLSNGNNKKSGSQFAGTLKTIALNSVCQSKKSRKEESQVDFCRDTISIPFLLTCPFDCLTLNTKECWKVENKNLLNHGKRLNTKFPAAETKIQQLLDLLHNTSCLLLSQSVEVIIQLVAAVKISFMPSVIKIVEKITYQLRLKAYCRVEER